MEKGTKILLGLLAGAVALFLLARYTKVGQDATATIADSVGDFVSGTTRGIRNNNPGNLVRNSIQWEGALTQAQVEAAGLTWDPKFVQFSAPNFGVRAIGHTLLSYQARGVNTVDEIIRGTGGQGGGYSETDQDAYVANLTTALGLDPTNGGQYTVIDIGSNLPALAAGIITQENGQQPYALSDIATWVYT